jgi:hypothetical protein
VVKIATFQGMIQPLINSVIIKQKEGLMDNKFTGGITNDSYTISLLASE